jgi:glycosyltransferase involved in cell wall biosynthesis
MARTELVRRVGCFDEQLSVLADWDLWIRLLQVGRAAARPELLTGYRVHRENLHRSGISGIRDELRYLRRKHSRLCAELGVELGGLEFEHWLVARQRESGKRIATAYSSLLLGRRSRRRREFARAAGMLFGEPAMRLGQRPEPTAQSAAPATEPAWLVEHRERAKSRPLASDEWAFAASVIVPVRNGSTFLERLLPALEAQSLDRSRFEIIVADDGSTDGVEEVVRESDLVRLSSGPPINAFAARNRAVRVARAPAIAFCDVDCLPGPTWLEAGLAALEEADVVAGAVRFDVPDRRTVWTLLDIDTTKNQEAHVRAGNAETANLFVRRDLFERVGGFDPSLPEHGDFDFAIRCIAAGARLVYGAEAIARHPTRNRPGPFLRMMWEMNRWYAVRESRAGRKPIALKLREWVPIAYVVYARRRRGRSLGLDRRWLAENGVHASVSEQLKALPLLYVLLPYERCIAQLTGWWQGRRLRRSPSGRRVASLDRR